MTNQSYKQIAKIVAGVSWVSLGFYRGTRSYEYEVNKYAKHNTPVEDLYCGTFLYGVAGVFLYVFPPFSLIMIPKEIFRLEVNLRGLDHLKKSSSYSDLI